jgi:arginyl-tRNA synthetase
MATLLPEGIQALLAGLGVESPIPTIAGTDVQHNPIDIYLSYLADTLVQLTECSPQVAYDSIQWPNDLGDLVVVLPRLRLQTKNPKTLSTELKQKV